MKPSTAKRKGATTEQMFVDFLRRWAPFAERRHLSGSADRGDVAGTPGICWEVKSGARLSIAQWLDELAAEVEHDNARHGVIVVRPPGRPAPRDWFVVMTLPDLMELLVEAQWLTEPEEPT